MSEVDESLAGLLAMVAPVPMEHYVEQLAQMSAGKQGMAQQLRELQQQVQRLERLHAPSAREIAQEISTVTRIAARRRAGTMSDGTAAWRKIGPAGELLPLASEEWSAALDQGYELMWTVNTRLQGEWPHRSGRCQWRTVLQQLAMLNYNGWCGHRDWRLPTLDELKTLLQTGAPSLHAGTVQQDFCISSQFFPDLQGEAEYWSSNSDQKNEQHMQTLSFSQRTVGTCGLGGYAHLRLVRSARGHG